MEKDIRASALDWVSSPTRPVTQHGVHVLREVPRYSNIVGIKRDGTENTPEAVDPSDRDGLKEDGDKEGETGGVVLKKAEDVEPALGKECDICQEERLRDKIPN